MSLETALLLALAMFLVGYVWLHGRFDSLQEQLRDLRTRIDDIPISEETQYRRWFDSASNLTIKDVRQWKKDEHMLLVEECVFYPATKPVYICVEYRHDKVDEITKWENFGFRAHGRHRSDDGEWKPYEFDVGETGCSSGAGSCVVRRVIDPGFLSIQ
jgi:hypothetical protein